MLLKFQKGFTLIELMITIAIIAIIAALALPSFRNVLERQRLVGATEHLFANLQFARSEAIKQNQSIRFQFDTNSWCFGVDDDGANCDCTTPSTCTVNSAQRVTNSSDYADVLLASDLGVAIIDFEPRQGFSSIPVGTPGIFTFSINGQSKTVTVNAVGRIKMD